jgi:NTP pyrophosphatase (non-canonical NTP hydrolase)
MDIKEFQSLMRVLYYEKDKKRGVDKTFLWLLEEIGELSQALRKGDAQSIENELADVIAWTTSLANLLNIDLEDSLSRKYPGVCNYCRQAPCQCEK